MDQCKSDISLISMFNIILYFLLCILMIFSCQQIFNFMKYVNDANDLLYHMEKNIVDFAFINNEMKKVSDWLCVNMPQ